MHRTAKETLMQIKHREITDFGVSHHLKRRTAFAPLLDEFAPFFRRNTTRRTVFRDIGGFNFIAGQSAYPLFCFGLLALSPHFI